MENNPNVGHPEAVIIKSELANGHTVLNDHGSSNHQINNNSQISVPMINCGHCIKDGNHSSISVRPESTSSPPSSTPSTVQPPSNSCHGINGQQQLHNTNNSDPSNLQPQSQFPVAPSVVPIGQQLNCSIPDQSAKVYCTSSSSSNPMPSSMINTCPNSLSCFNVSSNPCSSNVQLSTTANQHQMVAINQSSVNELQSVNPCSNNDDGPLSVTSPPASCSSLNSTLATSQQEPRSSETVATSTANQQQLPMAGLQPVNGSTSPPLATNIQPSSSGQMSMVTTTATSSSGGQSQSPPATPSSSSSSTLQPKRLHVSNIPFRFRDPDLRQLFGVSFLHLSTSRGSLSASLEPCVLLISLNEVLFALDTITDRLLSRCLLSLFYWMEN